MFLLSTSIPVNRVISALPAHWPHLPSMWPQLPSVLVSKRALPDACSPSLSFIPLPPLDFLSFTRCNLLQLHPEILVGSSEVTYSMFCDNSDYLLHPGTRLSFEDSDLGHTPVSGESRQAQGLSEGC